MITFVSSTDISVKPGSYRILLGSMFIGDWRLPLLQRFQSGFINPQNDGPDIKVNRKCEKDRKF